MPFPEGSRYLPEQPELPSGLRDVFRHSGYGCAAFATHDEIIHACHASDKDIEGFYDQPVLYQWQLVKMSTAPLLRLELVILDRPENPYQFESFLNVGDGAQKGILTHLIQQDRLQLAFYDYILSYRYTKLLPHGESQQAKLQNLAAQAWAYWLNLPPSERDFDLAKASFTERTWLFSG